MPWSLLPELLGLSPASLVSVKELPASDGKGGIWQSSPSLPSRRQDDTVLLGSCQFAAVRVTFQRSLLEGDPGHWKSTNPLFLA